jgi:hypothetical protein
MACYIDNFILKHRQLKHQACPIATLFKDSSYSLNSSEVVLHFRVPRQWSGECHNSERICLNIDLNIFSLFCLWFDNVFIIEIILLQREDD